MRDFKNIIDVFTKEGKTISTMESCTGGGVVNAITNIEGASEVLKYSAVTYSNLSKVNYTMIFYEAPHRILKTLQNMKEIFGDRDIAICREISKIHEEVIRGKISYCIDNLKMLKGEFVVVVSGCNEEYNYSDLDIVSHVNLYRQDGMSEMDAIKLVAKERGVAKSIIYKEYTDNK